MKYIFRINEVGMGVVFYGEKKSMQCSNLGSAELAKF